MLLMSINFSINVDYDYLFAKNKFQFLIFNCVRNSVFSFGSRIPKNKANLRLDSFRQRKHKMYCRSALLSFCNCISRYLFMGIAYGDR